MGNFIIEPDSKHLISVLAHDGLEHPYRFQKDLVIRISFEEYREFCKDMVSVKLPFLSFELGLYKRALTENGNQLLRLFYHDVSKAVISEVILAMVRGENATVIQHSFLDGTVIDMNSVEEEFKSLPEKSIQKSFDTLEKELIPGTNVSELSEHNRRCLSYGLYLHALSWTGSCKQVNVKGDWDYG